MIGRWVLGVFACLLLAVGVMGFARPGERQSTSTAPAYNVFHLVFGALGLALAVWGNPAAVRGFLVGFGVIDLYQAVASRRHWFPESWFRWTPADDRAHLVVGAALVLAGALLRRAGPVGRGPVRRGPPKRRRGRCGPRAGRPPVGAGRS